MNEPKTIALNLLRKLAGYYCFDWKKHIFKYNKLPEDLFWSKNNDKLDSYFIICLVSELTKIVKEGLTISDIKDRIDYLRNKEMPSSIKSLTDGSRGQWRVSNKNSIDGLVWFLEEYYGDDIE